MLDLKIAAQPVRTSKSGKQYQTASMIELLSGEVAVPNGATPSATGKDPAAQWKEKYRLTMSNLLSAAIQSGNDVDFDKIDSYVRKILNAQYDGEIHFNRIIYLPLELMIVAGWSAPCPVTERSYGLNTSK